MNKVIIKEYDEIMEFDESRLEHIPYVYQPIFDVSGDDDIVIGYEALMRPKNSNPSDYIEKVVEMNDTHRLEFLTFYNAIRQFQERGLSGKLFINSFPYEVLTPAEFEILKEGMSDELRCNIVIENLEYGDKISLLMLANKANVLRAQGFQIALDDFGMGINSVEMLKFIKPDVVKIDRYYVAGCTKNQIARNTIEIVTESIKANKSLVLAEGVETAAEYKFLKSLKDIKFMQGFYLGLPE